MAKPLGSLVRHGQPHTHGPFGTYGHNIWTGGGLIGYGHGSKVTNSQKYDVHNWALWGIHMTKQ